MGELNPFVVMLVGAAFVGAIIALLVTQLGRKE